MRLVHYLFFLALVLLGSSQKQAPTVAGWLGEARILYDSARYDRAMQRGQDALLLCEPGSREAADCLMLLGDVLLETGDFDGAYQQYQQALEIRERLSGPSDLATAEVVNRIGEYHYRKTDYPNARSWFLRALNNREKHLGRSHELVADGYNNLGNCLVGAGKYAEAAQLHRKALAIREKALPAGHPDLAVSFNNLGNCAYLGGDFEQAIRNFSQALAIRQRAFGAAHPKTAQVWNNLGNAHAALSNRAEAIRCYEKALEIRSAVFGNKHPDVAAALENIGDLYFDDGDYMAALDHLRKAYSIQVAAKGKESTAAATLLHNIGMCYQYEGDFDRALELYRTVEPVLTGKLGANHPLTGTLYNNLGTCLSAKKQYSEALGCYRTALAVLTMFGREQAEKTGLVLNNLGDVYLHTGQPEQALKQFKQAENLLRQATGNTSSLAFCLRNEGLALEKLGRGIEAEQVIRESARLAAQTDPVTENTMLDSWATLLCQRGIQLNDSSLLRESIVLFDRSRLKSDSLRTMLHHSASRQRWLEMQFSAHAGAIEACYHLWKLTGDPSLLEKAFAVSERNKSVQLLEHLRKEQAESTAGVPDSLLEQERKWGELLNRKEKELLAHPKNNEGRMQAELEISEIRDTQQRLLRRFEKEFPDYFRLKYEQRTATIADIRNQWLQPGRALLEYFVSDSAVFVFVITDRDFKCLRLQPGFPLDERVAALRTSINRFPNAHGIAAQLQSDTFVRLANSLYRSVVEPVEQAVSLPENITLIPDGPLAYLPFDCLIRRTADDPARFKNHEYLIGKYCISYAWSATQQLALLEHSVKKLPQNILAVAPEYDNNRLGLSPLLNNREEAQKAFDLFGGDLLEGSAATLDAFNHTAGRAHILLLSMHGKASSTVGDLSYIAFSSGPDSGSNPLLYARDLYSRSIPADLVVLSACETSVGAYRYGQGAVSLAKAFVQAGAASVAATLWSVDDAKNAELMQLFLQGIQKGLSKDAALREAKTGYLRTHPHDEAHPVYWAAVTVYGDMRPVRLEGAFQWMWTAAGVFVLLAFLSYRVWKSRKRG